MNINIKNIIIIILICLLFCNISKENMISSTTFTKGVIDGATTIETRLKLLKEMEKCNKKRSNFYMCINGLNLIKKHPYKPYIKKKNIDYLKNKDTNDLELTSF